MARKIKSVHLVDLNERINNLPKLNGKSIKFEDDTNWSSSDKFDNGVQMVYSNILRYSILFNAVLYTMGNGSLIPKQWWDLIQSLREKAIMDLAERAQIRGNMEKVQAMLNEYDIAAKNTTREKWSQDASRIIFNDNSVSHLAAFKVKSKADIPKHNFLMKLKSDTGGTIHIRTAVKITKGSSQLTFKLIDVVNKKTGNE